MLGSFIEANHLGMPVEWIAEFGMFAAKALTVLLAVVFVLLLIASLKGRQRKGEGALTVTRLNDQLARMTERLGQAVLDKPALKALQKTRKQEHKARAKQSAERQDRKSVVEGKRREGRRGRAR